MVVASGKMCQVDGYAYHGLINLMVVDTNHASRICAR